MTRITFFTVLITIAVAAVCVGETEFPFEPLEADPVWLNGSRESVFPRSPKPADTVYTFDISKVDVNDRILLTTAQGLINKIEPQLFLISSVYDTTFSEETKWIEWLKENGYVKDTATIDSAEDILEKWGIKEVILIDPNLPASLNVATMMAAFEEIPIAYADTAEKFNLKIKIDLTDRFKTNIEAYQWAFDEYWDKMDQSVVAWYCSTVPHSHLRDYLVANKIFTFWVTGKDDGNPLNSNTAKEKEFIRKLLATKIPVGIPVIGFPCGGAGEGIGEIEGVLIIGRTGKYHVCNNWRPNLTVWSGLDAKKKQYRQLPPQNIKLENDKVYVSLLMSDGDNMNTWFNWFKEYWQSPEHGQIPIAWTMGPTIIDMQGPLVDYYFDDLKQTDSIGCAVSGAGYIHPAHFGLDFKQEHRDKVWKEYLRITDKYMNKLDMNWIHIFRFGDAENVPYKSIGEMPSVKSIFSDYWGWLEYDKMNYMAGDVPVFHALKDTNNGLPNDPVGIILKNTPQQRPLFMHIFLTNWLWKYPDIKKMVDHLPEDFIVVRPDEMTMLYKKMVRAAIRAALIFA